MEPFENTPTDISQGLEEKNNREIHPLLNKFLSSEKSATYAGKIEDIKSNLFPVFKYDLLDLANSTEHFDYDASTGIITLNNVYHYNDLMILNGTCSDLSCKMFQLIHEKYPELLVFVVYENIGGHGNVSCVILDSEDEITINSKKINKTNYTYLLNSNKSNPTEIQTLSLGSTGVIVDFFEGRVGIIKSSADIEAICFQYMVDSPETSSSVKLLPQSKDGYVDLLHIAKMPDGAIVELQNVNISFSKFGILGLGIRQPGLPSKTYHFWDGDLEHVFKGNERMLSFIEKMKTKIIDSGLI